MVKYLKLITIEAYFLIIFPSIGILIICIINPTALSLSTILFYFLFGSSSLIFVTTFIYFYFLIKIILPFARFIVFKDNNFKKDYFIELKNLFKSQIYFSLLLGCGLYFINVFMNFLSITTGTKKIIWTSNLLMDYDYMIFGKDQIFQISSFVNKNGGVVLSWILINSYAILQLVLSILLFILFLHNKSIARKFLLFFFMVQFISIPIWYLLPAVEPARMYIDNAFKIEPKDRIIAQIADYQPDYLLTSFQKKISNSYEKHDGYNALTTFPSMHTAWGFGILAYSFLFWPPLILITLPWFILEITGAIYVGQHYVVDLFLGIIMAIIAIFLIEVLFLIEKKYYSGNGSLFIIDTIQKDAKDLATYFKKHFLILKN